MLERLMIVVDFFIVWTLFIDHWDGLLLAVVAKIDHLSSSHRFLELSFLSNVSFYLSIWSTLCMCLHWSASSCWSFCFNSFAPFIFFPSTLGYKLAWWHRHCPFSSLPYATVGFRVMINYLPMQNKPIGVDCLHSHMTTVFNLVCLVPLSFSLFFSLAIHSQFIFLRCSGAAGHHCSVRWPCTGRFDGKLLNGLSFWPIGLPCAHRQMFCN